MQKAVERKLQEIATELSIPYKEVVKAYESQFELVKQIAEGADRHNPDSFKSVRLIKFGLFHVKESVKKAYIEEKIKTNQVKD